MKRTRKELVKLHKKYHYIVDIARHLGLTRERVRQLFHLYKISYRKKPHSKTLFWIEKKCQIRQRNNQMLCDYKKGMSLVDLSRKYHISVKTCKKTTGSLRSRLLKTRNKIICSLYKTGNITQKELARKYNIGQPYVHTILKFNGILGVERAP